jgi:hypothetical protein
MLVSSKLWIFNISQGQNTAHWKSLGCTNLPVMDQMIHFNRNLSKTQISSKKTSFAGSFATIKIPEKSEELFQNLI